MAAQVALSPSLTPAPSLTPKEEEEDDRESINELDEDEYEKERLANIKERDSLLASLGLSSTAKPSFRPRPGDDTKPKLKLSEREQRLKDQPRAKRRKVVAEPTRRSGRVAAMVTDDPDGSGGRGGRPDYSDDKPLPVYTAPAPLIPKGRAPVIPSGPEYEDDDEGVTATTEGAPPPTREADGTLVFEGRWKGVFTPNVTPKEMFDGGAFGGGFFTDTYSQVLKTPLSSADALASLPFTPNQSVVMERYTNPDPEGAHNRFQVRAGQSLQEWEKAGWIWSGDPRGWAEWYTRFWGGRRCADDLRQVQRWLKVAGPTGRFKRSLLKKIHISGGASAIADEEVGAVVRQCLWQWGYELNQGEYERAMRGDD